MRDTKFRGKRIDSNKWVYGYYVAFSMPQDYPRFKVEHRIYTHLDEADCSVSFKVIPETVGQFTGLKDKNGKEEYHKDIVKSPSGILGVIEWDEKRACWCYEWQDKQRTNPLRYFDYVDEEVIGNIHENKDLLNEK